jgi:ADP-ribosyl-[dinitrogen reductase] hydrolase
VAWLFNDYQTVMKEARKATVVSHCHREAVKGAQCIASLVFLLRTARISKTEVEGYAKRKFGYKLPQLEAIFKIGSEGHFDSSCQETVPMALRCFIESNSYEEAIRNAVMARGDTDTKANITGALAEACFGLPEGMAEKALEYLEPDMLDVLTQTFTHIQDIIRKS